ncbi:MAG TPA: hypothetical protein VFW07_18785 [Parafilimonas sp.]|nr:hypothetical protein [Parafilimonas sp.]
MKVKHKRPVAMAFREYDNLVHIKVALAYDENCFILFDPYIAKCEKYYFYQARADFFENDRCFDILIINYVPEN